MRVTAAIFWGSFSLVSSLVLAENHSGNARRFRPVFFTESAFVKRNEHLCRAPRRVSTEEEVSLDKSLLSTRIDCQGGPGTCYVWPAKLLLDHLLKSFGRVTEIAPVSLIKMYKDNEIERPSSGRVMGILQLARTPENHIFSENPRSTASQYNRIFLQDGLIDAADALSKGNAQALLAWVKEYGTDELKSFLSNSHNHSKTFEEHLNNCLKSPDTCLGKALFSPSFLQPVRLPKFNIHVYRKTPHEEEVILGQLKLGRPVSYVVRNTQHNHVVAMTGWRRRCCQLPDKTQRECYNELRVVDSANQKPLDDHWYPVTNLRKFPKGDFLSIAPCTTSPEKDPHLEVCSSEVLTYDKVSAELLSRDGKRLRRVYEQNHLLGKQDNVRRAALRDHSGKTLRALLAHSTQVDEDFFNLALSKAPSRRTLTVLEQKGANFTATFLRSRMPRDFDIKNSSTFQFFKQKGMNPLARDSNGDSLLHKAAFSKHGSPTYIARLLNERLSPNILNKQHVTPLGAALLTAKTYGRTDILHQLCLAGADPTMNGYYGHSILSEAEKLDEKAYYHTLLFSCDENLLPRMHRNRKRRLNEQKR